MNSYNILMQIMLFLLIKTKPLVMLKSAMPNIDDPSLRLQILVRKYCVKIRPYRSLHCLTLSTCRNSFGLYDEIGGTCLGPPFLGAGVPGSPVSIKSAPTASGPKE
jgi:hypothetical protein